MQFYFYPVSALERVFGQRSFAAAGLFVSQLNNELLPSRLDAITALQEHRKGIVIGHTVVVMVSILKNVPSRQ